MTNSSKFAYDIPQKSYDNVIVTSQDFFELAPVAVARRLQLIR